MGLTQNDVETLTDKEFFFAALKQSIPETLFYGFLAVIIFLATKLSWWVALILFIPYCVLGIISFF